MDTVKEAINMAAGEDASERLRKRSWSKKSYEVMPMIRAMTDTNKTS